MQGQWGSLSYVDANSVTHTQELFVTAITQPQDLSGSTFQSRYKRDFYPRAHMPGDVQVEGYAKTSEDLQALAWFIRQHQRIVMDIPTGNFQFVNSAASQSLLKLSIPTEKRQWRGLIKTFSVEKKGLLVVAPVYNFNLQVIFDDTSSNIGISNRLNKYYGGIA